MTPKPTPELKSCPFCGEKQIYLNLSDDRNMCQINCPACLVAMPNEAGDIEEMIGCWNTRTRPSDEGLERGIRSVIDGDYRTTKKSEQCKHFKYGYEDCENCVVEYLQAILNERLGR